MINSELFFLATENGLICWNFKEHRQFILNRDYALRLVNLAYDNTYIDPENRMDQELLASNLLTLKQDNKTTWGWDPLSRIFHFGTRDIPLEEVPYNVEEWARSYLQHCNEVLDNSLPIENHARYTNAGIKLPPAISQSPFEELLSKRATVRSFLDKPVSLTIVSHLLQHTLGFIQGREKPHSNLPESLRKRRCSPSGGGLNATEGYLYANNVTDLKPGLYYYDPFHHELHIHDDSCPNLGSLLSGQHFANNLPVGLFLTSRLDKLWWKYAHSRAYRMALVEIGHVAQTFQLEATDLGLGTWLTGALNETPIESILDLTNPAEQVLFFVGAGYTDGSDTPEALKQLLNARNI